MIYYETERGANWNTPILCEPLNECYNNQNYSIRSLKFIDWLEHPVNTQGFKFDNPKSLLLLENGDFLIMENDKLNILNKNFSPLQPPILGRFNGLQECPDGSVYTIEDITVFGKREIHLRELVKCDSTYHTRWHENIQMWTFYLMTINICACIYAFI